LLTGDFVVPLAKAVQEQQKIIEELKTQSLSQQKENEQLKKDIAAIKQSWGCNKQAAGSINCYQVNFKNQQLLF